MGENVGRKMESAQQIVPSESALQLLSYLKSFVCNPHHASDCLATNDKHTNIPSRALFDKLLHNEGLLAMEMEI